MAELDRIRWHCRRGLLELDLVLADFLARHLETLDSQQLENFRELLDYPDNDLLDLVMGRAELCDTRCQPMLDLLRAGRLEFSRQHTT
jgi:succinate dehydrogenase flavin-adding protein (antitoxin of CptAB toxin-antitoxin module)